MHLQVKARQLGHAKKELERDLEQLKDQLDQQKENRTEQERRVGAQTLISTIPNCESLVDWASLLHSVVFIKWIICLSLQIAVLEESMKTFEEETKDLQSQEEQVQSALLSYFLSSPDLFVPS